MYNERYFLKHEQHFFDQFEFENGFIMENVKVDYGVFGTPKYDDEGNIINAILFCHNFEGNYSRISDFNSWTEKTKFLIKMNITLFQSLHLVFLSPAHHPLPV